MITCDFCGKQVEEKATEFCCGNQKRVQVMEAALETDKERYEMLTGKELRKKESEVYG